MVLKIGSFIDDTQYREANIDIFIDLHQSILPDTAGIEDQARIKTWVLPTASLMHLTSQNILLVSCEKEIEIEGIDPIHYCIHSSDSIEHTISAVQAVIEKTRYLQGRSRMVERIQYHSLTSLPIKFMQQFEKGQFRVLIMRPPIRDESLYKQNAPDKQIGHRKMAIVTPLNTGYSSIFQELFSEELTNNNIRLPRIITLIQCEHRRSVHTASPDEYMSSNVSDQHQLVSDCPFNSANIKSITQEMPSPHPIDMMGPIIVDIANSDKAIKVYKILSNYSLVKVDKLLSYIDVITMINQESQRIIKKFSYGIFYHLLKCRSCTNKAAFIRFNVLSAYNRSSIRNSLRIVPLPNGHALNNTDPYKEYTKIKSSNCDRLSPKLVLLIMEILFTTLILLDYVRLLVIKCASKLSLHVLHDQNPRLDSTGN